MLTKGWDTISIVNQDKVNSDLQACWGDVDSSFREELPDSAGQIEGSFGSFRIVNGGGGRIVRMELPIQTGSLLLKESRIDLGGTSAVIEITLSMLPENAGLTVLKTEYKNLAKNREEMAEDKGGWILPVTFVDPDGRTGPYANVVLDGICSYLLQHPEQLEFVLAEINYAKSTCPEWARPQKCAYSYLDSGHLAVMAVCDDREITSLPLDIDVTGISLNTNSLYVMSSELMLKNLILPGLSQLYQSADPNSYTCRDREWFNNRELKMRKIKSGAIYYTPIVKKGGNVIKVSGNYITVTYSGKCDMYAGINMNWNGSVKLKAALNNNGTLSFYREGVSFSDDEDIPWFLAWLLPVIGQIIQIVVAIISDDLMDDIERISASIRARSIDTVTWCREEAVLNSAYISESLVLEYK